MPIILPQNMKRLIVNADDFGLSERVNAGIIDSFNNGILTSTSLMANGPEFENAVLLAKQAQGLAIGVHLNAVRGKPILESGYIRSLTDKNGYFFNYSLKTFLSILRKRNAFKELENEFSAQIEKVISFGIKPTHLDTEKHLHIVPGVFKILLKLCEKYGIKGVRGFFEKPCLYDFLNMRKLGLCAAGNAVSMIMQKNTKNNVFMPKRTYGFLESGKIDIERCINIFKDSYDGIAEIICHPGYEGQNNGFNGGMGKYYVNSFRQIELKALTSPIVKDMACRAGIKFIDYSGVNV